jgi:hypothetical protein
LIDRRKAASTKQTEIGPLLMSACLLSKKRPSPTNSLNKRQKELLVSDKSRIA